MTDKEAIKLKRGSRVWSTRGIWCDGSGGDQPLVVVKVRPTHERHACDASCAATHSALTVECVHHPEDEKFARAHVDHYIFNIEPAELRHAEVTWPVFDGEALDVHEVGVRLKVQQREQEFDDAMRDALNRGQ